MGYGHTSLGPHLLGSPARFAASDADDSNDANDGNDSNSETADNHDSNLETADNHDSNSETSGIMSSTPRSLRRNGLDASHPIYEAYGRHALEYCVPLKP